MASDRTDESDRRAFEADIRNAALEEAAQVAAVWPYWTLPMPEQIAAAIRALKSDPAPVPAPKPFTFADPAAQLQHERHRAESRRGERE
jgi:hypothetical protein